MKLVLYGDSLTAGFGVRQSYAYCLQQLLQGTAVSVLVRGQNGRSARMMVDDFSREVVSATPDVVFVLAGLNDIILEGASAETVILAYNALLQRCQDQCISMVLGINPVPGICLDSKLTSWLPVGARECAMLSRLSEVAGAWAEEKRVPLVDFPTALAKRFPDGYTMLFSDGVHPIDEVHRAMAEILCACLWPGGLPVEKL